MNSRLHRFFPAALLILPAFCTASFPSACGQGEVVLGNNILGTVITHVYLPLSGNPGLVQIGNGTADYPPGTIDWTGWTPVSGSGFTAQLFGAAGSNVPLDSLAPALPTSTFGTGTRAGFAQFVIVSIPGAPEFSNATVQMRVWDNHGGTITDWATALAQPSGTELVGTSLPLYVGPLGGPGALPPNLNGLQSFNLYYVPEPSAFALAVLGLLLLIIGRCCWMR